jgi:hypothetical protein
MEEVTFRDLMKGTGKSKVPRLAKKIKFCGEQATRDGM